MRAGRDGGSSVCTVMGGMSVGVSVVCHVGVGGISMFVVVVMYVAHVWVGDASVMMAM